jgi:hypothetical protein
MGEQRAGEPHELARVAVPLNPNRHETVAGALQIRPINLYWDLDGAKTPGREPVLLSKGSHRRQTVSIKSRADACDKIRAS